MFSKEQQKGEENPSSPVYVDLLDEDKPISGQKFVCVSFVSPENILKRKDLFYMEEFIKSWDMAKSMEKFQGFLNFISYKYNLNSENVIADYKDFVKEERDELRKFTIEDDYKNFLDLQEEELEKKFNVQNKFQTSTRGMKVRGVYSTQEEAEMRCKMLRESDPNHDVYVGPVGMWMPWEPEAYKTGRVEYLEEELNNLMHEKINNEKQAKIEFDKRVQEAKEKAMEDNAKLAEKTGNQLTQLMDDDGKLVNVRELDLDAIPDETVLTEGAYASADVRNELFDRHNLVRHSTVEPSQMADSQEEKNDVTDSNEPDQTSEEDSKED